MRKFILLLSIFIISGGLQASENKEKKNAIGYNFLPLEGISYRRVLRNDWVGELTLYPNFSSRTDKSSRVDFLSDTTLYSGRNIEQKTFNIMVSIYKPVFKHRYLHLNVGGGLGYQYQTSKNKPDALNNMTINKSSGTRSSLILSQYFGAEIFPLKNFSFEPRFGFSYQSSLVKTKSRMYDRKGELREMSATRQEDSTFKSFNNEGNLLEVFGVFTFHLYF